MLTRERLLEVLRYEPETGKFYSKGGKGRAPVGEEAGTLRETGYRFVVIDGRRYGAHRLVWLAETGALPVNEIDHRNRVHDDNRFGNLEDATRAENAQNLPRRKDNTSGVPGVRRVRGRWRAEIGVGGKTMHLGAFARKEDAVAAREAARKEHHFYGSKIDG